MIAWHVPRVYDCAAALPLVHDLQHVCFVVAGLLAWTQLVDPARHERLRRPRRIFFALGMLVLAQPVVDALLFSSKPLYGRYAHPADPLFGISPLTDQRLAGVVMMTEQLLTLGICVALLLRPYLRERRTRARPAFSRILLAPRRSASSPSFSCWRWRPATAMCASGIGSNGRAPGEPQFSSSRSR